MVPPLCICDLRHRDVHFRVTVSRPSRTVRNGLSWEEKMDVKRRDVLKGAAAVAATAATAGGAAIITSTPTYAQQVDAAKKWVDSEFQPSTLSKDEQMAEMEWFIKASTPFKGLKLSTVSEILSIHDYESKVLTKAFADITGIQVSHELLDEGKLVDKIEIEIQSGKPIYDFWMNDSDFIGTHPRYNDIVGGSLTDFMAKDGKDVTNPGLDLSDFIGLSFATFTDGKLYQLPDQQFANLYWFRYDWFQKPELKSAFKAKYGYDLGVPVNWSAYEDIADFFTDAWLSMAGNGDRGLPNGRPVDEWGIRAENGIPVGSSISRGGDANGPAAVYALAKFVEWLEKYAPPEAAGMDFLEAGAVPGQGHIAQQIFWYSAFTHALSEPGLPVMNADGTPKWRMAPSPHGAYWKEGMKLGYQDQGCWTMLKYAPLERVKAGWLYAQFCVSKTVTLKKSVISLHLIRESDIWSDAMTAIAPKTGGLVEFYRSPARKLWTPTGVNVPDYGRLAQVWWQNVSKAISGEATPQQAMDGLARDQDAIMAPSKNQASRESSARR